MWCDKGATISTDRDEIVPYGVYWVLIRDVLVLYSVHLLIRLNASMVVYLYHQSIHTPEQSAHAALCILNPV